MNAFNICQKHIKEKGKNYLMPNLVGVQECDEYILMELLLCNVPNFKITPQGEVPATYKGILNGFTFRRAWRYWVVSGNVPIEIANKLYEDPEGRQYVRVAGHCGCPIPQEWATKIDGQLYVDCYHIDTFKGLKLFTDAIRNL